MWTKMAWRGKTSKLVHPIIFQVVGIYERTELIGEFFGRGGGELIFVEVNFPMCKHSYGGTFWKVITPGAEFFLG